jgi:hypothetical protein
MLPRSLVLALIVLPCALLVMGFGSCSPSPQLYRPQFDASLLQPCQDPVLEGPNPSDNEVAAADTRIAKAYVDCRDRHATLIGRIKDDPPKLGGDRE